MAELLVALPVLLLASLAAIQLALWMHARDALQLAVLEAARAGSVEHAHPDAIEAGLARGLVPLVAARAAVSDPRSALAAAHAEVRTGLAEGRIELHQRSPVSESFSDWGAPVLDRDGLPTGAVEIPIDDLARDARLRAPASGIAGDAAGSAYGLASGQTLFEATLLRIDLVYGASARVPLAGPLIARTLAWLDGCPQASPTQPIGALMLPRPAAAPRPRATCAHYAAVDAGGRPDPRVPIRATAIVRMQSAPRPSALLRGRAEALAAAP